MACGGDDANDTATFVTTIPPQTTISESPDDLVLFERMEVVVAGEAWLVAVADTPLLRAQGLMGVSELVGVDGMLFVFEEPAQVAFHMQDTLIPLDIAFFSEDGSLVDRFTMTPCGEVPCPRYPTTTPVQYAIETTVGGFEGLGPLTLDVSGLDW